MNVISKFTGQHAFLSNFFEYSLSFKGPDDRTFTFMSAEAAFQAAKFKVMDGDNKDKIEYVVKHTLVRSPKESKYLGRKVKIDVDKWESIKVSCMREVIYQKFTAEGFYEQEMGNALLNTGDAMLVEGNDWNDTFWGRCNGRGYNKLGVILMEVRGYLFWCDRYSRDCVEMGS